jgi:hypothetical protein
MRRAQPAVARVTGRGRLASGSGRRALRLASGCLRVVEKEAHLDLTRGRRSGAAAESRPGRGCAVDEMEIADGSSRMAELVYEPDWDLGVGVGP